MACTVDIDSVVETYEFALAELGSKREAMAVAQEFIEVLMECVP